VISCRDVFKIYVDKEEGIEAPVLRGLDIDIRKGEYVTILGPSGSGKTTLLRVLSGLELPTTGRVIVNDCLISKYNLNQRIDFLRKNVGFMVQNPKENLFLNLNCRKNLQLSSYIANNKKSKDLDNRIDRIMSSLKLIDSSKKLAMNLSGGEAQRLALGMLLVKKSPVILLDEPTGNLDAKNALFLVNKLRQIADSQQITVIMVTHNRKLAEKAHRMLFMRNGRISSFRNIGHSKYDSNDQVDLLFVSEDGDMMLSEKLAVFIEDIYFSCSEKDDEIVLDPVSLNDLDHTNNQLIINLSRRGELSIPLSLLERSGIAKMARVRIESGSIIITGAENG